jgi:hypothetical protein
MGKGLPTYDFTIVYRVIGTNEWKQRQHSVHGPDARQARIALFYEYLDAGCKVRAIHALYDGG